MTANRADVVVLECTYPNFLNHVAVRLLGTIWLGVSFCLGYLSLSVPVRR